MDEPSVSYNRASVSRGRLVSDGKRRLADGLVDQGLRDGKTFEQFYPESGWSHHD